MLSDQYSGPNGGDPKCHLRRKPSVIGRFSKSSRHSDPIINRFFCPTFQLVVEAASGAAVAAALSQQVLLFCSKKSNLVQCKIHL